MRKWHDKANRTAAQKILIICLIGIAGMMVGMFFIIPWNERIGNVVTMVFAFLTGAFYTRYLKDKRKNNQ